MAAPTNGVSGKDLLGVLLWPMPTLLLVLCLALLQGLRTLQSFQSRDLGAQVGWVWFLVFSVTLWKLLLLGVFLWVPGGNSNDCLCVNLRRRFIKKKKNQVSGDSCCCHVQCCMARTGGLSVLRSLCSY